MFEKWKARWNNATKRWGEYWIRWSLKNWRKADVSVVVLGLLLLVSASYVGNPTNVIFAIFAVFLMTMGFVCFCYDAAIKRVGCMEEVFRELQTMPGEKRESVLTQRG